MNLKDSTLTKDMTTSDLLIYKSIISKSKCNLSPDRRKQLRRYRKTLDELRKQPLIKQRTQEWYDARSNRLTASDLEEAVSNNNLRLAKRKAGVIKDVTNYASIPPLKWGTMFEPMAIRCYSQERDNIMIHEFGLLLDPVLEHFGASPDGINDMGIMVEIKCPYSREIIDNQIPHKYYMQIQGQLAVCKLQECDYIECNFATYETVLKYMDEIFNNYANTTVAHGVIAEYKVKQGDEYYYLYSSPDLTASAAYKDICEQMNKFTDQSFLFVKLTPWRLQQINVQRVTFDEELWNATMPKIQAFWEKVEECKLLPAEEIPQKPKIMFIEDDD